MNKRRINFNSLCCPGSSSLLLPHHKQLKVTSSIPDVDNKTSLSFQSFVSKANNNPPALKWNKTEDSSLSGGYPYCILLGECAYSSNEGRLATYCFPPLGPCELSLIIMNLKRILQYLFLNVEWTLSTLLENCKYDQQHQARAITNITRLSSGLFDTV